MTVPEILDSVQFVVDRRSYAVAITAISDFGELRLRRAQTSASSVEPLPAGCQRSRGNCVTSRPIRQANSSHVGY